MNAISGRTKSTALHLAVFSAMRDNVQELVQNGGAGACVKKVQCDMNLYVTGLN